MKHLLSKFLVYLYFLFVFKANCQQECPLLRLQHYEKKIFSQNGEDGILIALINFLGVKYRNYVEFGVQDGTECNSRVLREYFNFTGLMMDGDFDNYDINLNKEFVTVSNIHELFKKYHIPEYFDVLSIDTDMYDWWILAKILAIGYKPRIIVAEVNPTIGLRETELKPYFSEINFLPLTVTHPNNSMQSVWDMTRYSGANPAAYHLLAQHAGYELVYCESCGVNCFLVLKSEMPKECQNAFFPVPHVSMPCFGTYDGDMVIAGHKVDTQYRRPIQLTQSIVQDALADSLDPTVISELSVTHGVDPIPNNEQQCRTSSEWFSKYNSTNKYPSTTQVENLFSLSSNCLHFGIMSKFSETYCHRLNDEISAMAVTLINHRNFAVAAELLSYGFRLYPNNKIFEQLHMFSMSLSILSSRILTISTRSVTAEFHRHGQLTTKKSLLSVSICDNINDLALKFINSNNYQLDSHPYIVDMIYSDIQSNILRGSPYDVLYYIRGTNNTERGKDIPKIPQFLEYTIQDVKNEVMDFCKKKGTNIIILGAPKSGIDHLANVLIKNSHVADIGLTSSQIVHDINAKLLDSLGCTDSLVSYDSSCLNALYQLSIGDISPIRITSAERDQLLQTIHQFQYQNGLSKIFAHPLFSFVSYFWLASLRDVTVVFAIPENPTRAISCYAEEKNISDNMAVEIWMFHFAAAINTIRHQNSIILYFYGENNAAGDREVADFLGFHDEILIDQFSNDFSGDIGCSNRGDTIVLPTWLTQCFDSLRVDQRSLFEKCIAPF